MKTQIDTDKLDWTLEAEPQLYSSNPRMYIIYSSDFGTFTKKQAEIICAFLKNNFRRIIVRALP